MSCVKTAAARSQVQGRRTALLDTGLLARLLIRPSRHADEQAGGYWLRLAHCNGLNEPRWLLDRQAPRLMGLVRICPSCLDQPDARWPQAWSDREHPWCDKHHHWLVDRCTGCGQPLRWNGVQLLRCRCGAALAELPAKAMTSACLQALVVDRVAPLSVLIWLGALEKHGLIDKPMKKASRQSMADVVDLAERGATIVADWPGGFFWTLDACRVRGAGSDSLQLLNHSLPGLTRKVRKLSDPLWRGRILKELTAYAAASRSTHAPLVGRNARLAVASGTTVTSAAKALRIRTEGLSLALDTLADETVMSRRTASGRLRRLVTPQIAQRIQAERQDRIATKTAARLLGMSSDRVEQLVNANVLVRQTGCLSRQACDTLLKSILQMRVHADAPVEAIPLGEALRFWVPVARSSEFVHAVLCGNLKLFTSMTSASIHDTLLDRESLTAWATRPSESVSEWLSIPDCAKRLGVKQEVVYHLARTGLLQTQKAVVKRRTAQVVTLKAIDQFEQRYESLTTAARRAGVDWRQGLNWARSHGLRFASGPGVDGGRQYFLHRQPRQQRTEV